jgi:hypothetical protein
MSSDEITLIVVEPEAEGGGDGLPKESFELQSVKDWFPRLRVTPKPAKLSDLQGRMGEIQGEVEKLLSKMKVSTGGYHLAEVQVSLAISGSGSIGVATVGAEASIALTFAPSTAV